MRSWLEAVDRAVGPAGEHRADESFCFPVCLWPVAPPAAVGDAELAEASAEAAAGEGGADASMSVKGCW